MRSSLLEEVFDQKALDQLPALECRTISFAELVDELGLDPARDFRFADLRGVDLSLADLSGYDFSGADLRGAYGVGAKLDGVIIDDANVDGSLFEYRIRRREFFRKHPASYRILSSLLKHHWTGATIWVVEGLKGKKSNETVEIAKALFLDTNDNVLKGQILFFLSKSFPDKGSYFAFLLATLNEHGSNAAIRKSVVSSLGSMFYNRRAVYGILKAEIATAPTAEIPRLLASIIKSQHSPSDIVDLRRLMNDRLGREGTALLMRLMIQRLGQRYDVLLKEPLVRNELNFGAQLSPKALEWAALKSLSSQPLHLDAKPHLGLKIEPSEEEKEKERTRLRRSEQHVRQLLNELREKGLDIGAPPEKAPPAKKASAETVRS